MGGSSLCTSHGGGRRCIVDGCDKSAQSSTKFCVKHGGGKKCSHPNCEKVARGRTQFCAAVSVPFVLDGLYCPVEISLAVSGSHSRTVFFPNLVAQHGGGVRCKLAGCNRVAIGKLQLCRAHGGGARPKNGSIGGSSSHLSMLSNPAGATQQPVCQPMTAVNVSVQSEAATV